MDDVRFIGQNEQDLRDLFGGEIPDGARAMYGRLLRLYHRKGSGPLPPLLLLLIALLNGGGEKPPPKPSVWDGVPAGEPVIVRESNSRAPLHEHATFIAVGRDQYSGYLQVEVYGQRLYFTEDRVDRKPDAGVPVAENVPGDNVESEQVEAEKPGPYVPRQRTDWSQVEPETEVCVCSPGQPERTGKFIKKPGGNHEGLLYIRFDGQVRGYSRVPIEDAILMPSVEKSEPDTLSVSGDDPVAEASDATGDVMPVVKSGYLQSIA